MVTMPRAVPVIHSPRHPRISRRRPARYRSQRFGRRAPFTVAPQPVLRSAISDDMRLFAATFAGGFLFVTILLA
jgi:hypothetical protein